MFKKIIAIFRSNPDNQKRQELLFSKLKPGDIFIDCGANIGQETIPALERGATVYAFEPHPEAFETLKENSRHHKNAHLLNKGVWDRQATLKLYLHQNHDRNAVTWSTGSSLVKQKDNINPNNFVEIEVIDLTDFIEDLGKPIRFLKIDVEGVEFEILKKIIDRNIYKKIGHIFVETHADKMKNLRAKEVKIKQLIAKQSITNISLDWV